jgi:hypothetical protein
VQIFLSVTEKESLAGQTLFLRIAKARDSYQGIASAMPYRDAQEWRL